jgi:hypothetical protein
MERFLTEASISPYVPLLSRHPIRKNLGTPAHNQFAILILYDVLIQLLLGNFGTLLPVGFVNDC